MRQILRAGAISALVIVAAGCAWMKGAPEEGRVGPAPREGDVRPAAVVTPSTRRSPAEVLNVLFASGRWDLEPMAQTELRPLIKKLRANPRLTVDLEGYADSAGARDYNLALSRKRVESVRRFLVDQGVEPSRIRTIALGQVADAGKPQEQARNRRVTVRLMAASD